MIEAPLNANVWKVLVKEGDVLKSGQTVIILEAMKMEVNVNVDKHLDGATIEKLVAAPNDLVQSGKPLILARKKEAKGT